MAGNEHTHLVMVYKDSKFFLCNLTDLRTAQTIRDAYNLKSGRRIGQSNKAKHVYAVEIYELGRRIYP